MAYFKNVQVAHDCKHKKLITFEIAITSIIVKSFQPNEIYRFQDKMPPASAFDFGDVQFDSDREIASENEPGSDCDCNTASEQSNKSDSDPKEQHG